MADEKEEKEYCMGCGMHFMFCECDLYGKKYRSCNDLEEKYTLKARELIRAIEQYDFVSKAGGLKNCIEFIKLKKMF